MISYKVSIFIWITYVIIIQYQTTSINIILTAKKIILRFSAIAVIAYNCYPIQQCIGQGIILHENTISCRDISLKNLKPIGQGGTGIVYSGTIINDVPVHNRNNIVDTKESTLKELVAKLSRSNTQKSINYECEILNILEKANVPNIEHCLCNSNYEVSKDDIRSISILEPYFSIKDKDNNDLVVSTIDVIPSKDIQLEAIHNMLTTLIAMIENHIALSDVQLLIDSTTDFTESYIIKESVMSSYNDQQLVNSFIQECLSLIPYEYQINAKNQLQLMIKQSPVLSSNSYLNKLFND